MTTMWVYCGQTIIDSPLHIACIQKMYGKLVQNLHRRIYMVVDMGGLNTIYSIISYASSKVQGGQGSTTTHESLDSFRPILPPPDKDPTCSATLTPSDILLNRVPSQWCVTKTLDWSPPIIPIRMSWRPLLINTSPTTTKDYIGQPCSARKGLTSFYTSINEGSLSGEDKEETTQSTLKTTTTCFPGYTPIHSESQPATASQIALLPSGNW